MSISTPPPPVKKKRGLGCLGCGCAILLLLVVIAACLFAASAYATYAKFSTLTSPTSGSVATFDGGDQMYASTKQKVADFNHDLDAHLPATIHLTADELNTLIAHNPDLAQRNIHLFVTLTNDKGQVQISLPSELIPSGLFKGRFVNGSAGFGLNFDPASKSINLDLQSLQIGDEDAPKQYLTMMSDYINPALNQGLQKDPDGQNLLDHAKSIEIKDGELVIETQ